MLAGNSGRYHSPCFRPPFRPVWPWLGVPCSPAGAAWGPWRKALLGRLAAVPLPDRVADVDRVTAAPSAWPHRLPRGFDLSADVARLVAGRLGLPFEPLLRKGRLRGRQASRAESQRRRLPRRAIGLRRGDAPRGLILPGGPDDVRALTLFRAL